MYIGMHLGCPMGAYKLPLAPNSMPNASMQYDQRREKKTGFQNMFSNQGIPRQIDVFGENSGKIKECHFG